MQVQTKKKIHQGEDYRVFLLTHKHDAIRLAEGLKTVLNRSAHITADTCLWK